MTNLINQKLRVFDYDDLIILREIYRGGYFVSIGAKLRLNETCIRKRLKKMEVILGPKYFGRMNNGKRFLTREGIKLAIIVERFLTMIYDV